MKCMICGNDNLEYRDTVISDFVMDRISEDFVPGKNRKTRLCYCPECTFAFYEYRMTDEEQGRLYRNYRDQEYQKTREKYECWYTPKINEALNNDRLTLAEQRRVIERMLSENSDKIPEVSLDWGGNEGRTFTRKMGNRARYVFDISNIPTIKGVKSLSSFEEVKKHNYDFIMCNMMFEHLSHPVEMLEQFWEAGGPDTLYYIEVPSENPFMVNKFSIKKNLKLLVNSKYSNVRLAKYYLKRRKEPFMPMAEHINFYTPKSIRTMVENAGFTVLDVQENVEKAVLGDATVLSIMFKKK